MDSLLESWVCLIIAHRAEKLLTYFLKSIIFFILRNFLKSSLKTGKNIWTLILALIAI